MIIKRFHLQALSSIGGIIAELAGMSERFPLMLYIGDNRPNRSNNQNRYLWGVVYKIISTETGYTVNEVHELCKAQFAPKKILDNEKIRGILDGITIISVSTTELDTKEFTDYIEAIRQFYGEHGIEIPDANSIPDELQTELNKH